MLLENCGSHADQVKEVVVQCQGRFEIVCKECFGGGVKEYGEVGVVLCEDIRKFFVQWNQYLIDELQSILGNISAQGVDFLIKYLDQKQRKNYMEPNDMHFLRDLFIITTKTVEQILEHYKKELQQVLERLFNQEYRIEWKEEAIIVFETKRQQILNDCARNCLLKKAVSETSISKSQNSENEKVQTLHSINQSRSSCISLSFDEEIEKFDLSQCGDHDIIDRTQSYVIDTKKENQILLRLLKTKDEEIQVLNKKLAESEKNCQEWMEKYEVLQKTHKKLIQERIPIIEYEFDSLESTMQVFVEENDYFFHQIQQLNEKISSLKQENLQLKSKIPNHYINPLYEKKKIQQKFLTQIIQLQSQNLLKNDDLTIIISFLRLTKKKIQSMTIENWKDFTKNWEKQVMEKVNSLQSITIKQL